MKFGPGALWNMGKGQAGIDQVFRIGLQEEVEATGCRADWYGMLFRTEECKTNWTNIAIVGGAFLAAILLTGGSKSGSGSTVYAPVFR